MSPNQEDTDRALVTTTLKQYDPAESVKDPKKNDFIKFTDKRRSIVFNSLDEV